METMRTWNQLALTPETAKKPITGGRLNGFTDINPMWRFKRLTEVFGQSGEGWKTEITERQIVPGADGEMMVFVFINLYTKTESGEWSEAVPGIGGSMLIEKERSGLHNNDEAFKMAYSDAIGTACKALGMSEDVYMSGSGSTGSKYQSKKEELKLETVQDAAGYVLTFGKHQGKSLGELYKTERQYLQWLDENEKTDPAIKNGIRLLCAAAAAAKQNARGN